MKAVEHGAKTKRQGREVFRLDRIMKGGRLVNWIGAVYQGKPSAV